MGRVAIEGQIGLLWVVSYVLALGSGGGVLPNPKDCLLLFRIINQ